MSKLSKVAGHVNRAVQSAAPIEGAAGYGGYWNFVAAAIIMMFILYTAQKGTIGTWIGFFGWSPQAAPTTTSQTPTAAANPNTTTVIPGLTVTTNPLATPTTNPSITVSPTNPASVPGINPMIQ